MVRTLEKIGEEDMGLFDKRLALTLREVAEAIGRTERAVYLLVSRKKIPFHKVGKRLAFNPEEIRAWLNQAGANNVS